MVDHLLPSSDIPLNRHSLMSIERWLAQLGAEQSAEDLSLWNWEMPEWSAEIKIDQEELIVIWRCDVDRQCAFPYGLSRQDVEAALIQGP